MPVESVVTERFATMGVKAASRSGQAEKLALKQTQKVRMVIAQGRRAFLQARGLRDLRKDRIAEAQHYGNDWGPPYQAVALMQRAELVAEPTWGLAGDPEAYVCGFVFEAFEAGVLAIYVEDPRPVLVFDWLGRFGAYSREAKKCRKKVGFEGLYARAQACLRS